MENGQNLFQARMILHEMLEMIPLLHQDPGGFSSAPAKHFGIPRPTSPKCPRDVLGGSWTPSSTAQDAFSFQEVPECYKF